MTTSRKPRARFKGATSNRGRAVLWAIAHAKDLTCTERCVLFVLEAFVSYAERETGRSWPSVPTIAASAGMDERTARRALRRLEEKRWIDVEPRTDAGYCNSSIYRVTPPKGTPPPPVDPEATDANVNADGDTEANAAEDDMDVEAGADSPIHADAVH